MRGVTWKGVQIRFVEPNWVINVVAVFRRPQGHRVVVLTLMGAKALCGARAKLDLSIELEVQAS